MPLADHSLAHVPVPHPENAPRGTTWAMPYPRPIAAEVGGEAVVIIQIGDKPGFSPVMLVVGRFGIPTEVILSSVRMKDPEFLPQRDRREPGFQQQ